MEVPASPSLITPLTLSLRLLIFMFSTKSETRVAYEQAMYRDENHGGIVQTTTGLAYPEYSLAHSLS